MTAGEIVTEGLLVHEPSISRKERDRRAARAFEEVRLDPWRNRYRTNFPAASASASRSPAP